MQGIGSLETQIGGVYSPTTVTRSKQGESFRPDTRATSATGEEGLSAATADDPLSNLPNKVRVGALIPFMGIASLDCFSQTSKELCKEADEFAGKQLPSLKKELNELITNSGITGIKNPVGPFTNYIHELRVLTAFKDALPNAIRVLQDNDITDINAKSQIGTTPLHLAAINGQTETEQALKAAGAKRCRACIIM